MPPMPPPRRSRSLDQLAGRLSAVAPLTNWIPPAAKRAAWPEAGEQGPLWIWPSGRRRGRGRRGPRLADADWKSCRHLAAEARCARRTRSGSLSFAAALAVADTAAHFARRKPPITVKWPNDVLADGRKLAGILLESGRDATGTWLAVGYRHQSASRAARHRISRHRPLADLGVAPPSPDEALTLLAARFAHWYDGWMSGGFETLRTAWLARAGGLGLPIRARLASHEPRHGVFEA